MAKSNAGRPTKMSEVVIAKLEAAYSYDATDEEACVFADINPATLYRYQEKHPEFCERKAALKKKPLLKAKEAWINAFSEDWRAALEYAKRKGKDEFSEKIQQELSGEVATKGNTNLSNLNDEQLKKLSELIEASQAK